jgi:hypothetical protein
MHSRNVDVIWASMPMPDMIYARSQGIDADCGVRVRHVGKDIVMSFVNDNSLAYVQDKKTWEMYAFKRAFDGHKYGYHFNILIEPYKKIGITEIFQITKVLGPLRIVTEITENVDFVHIYDFIDDMPEIARVVRDRFSSEFSKMSKLDKMFSKMKTIPFPKKLLSETSNFLFDRRDNEVDRHQAGGILASKIHCVVVSHFRLQQGMIVEPVDFSDIVILLIIRAFVLRQKATKAISFATAFIIRGDKDMTFGEWLSEIITDIGLKINPLSGSAKIARFAKHDER